MHLPSWILPETKKSVWMFSLVCWLASAERQGSCGQSKMTGCGLTQWPLCVWPEMLMETLQVLVLLVQSKKPTLYWLLPGPAINVLLPQWCGTISMMLVSCDHHWSVRWVHAKRDRIKSFASLSLIYSVRRADCRPWSGSLNVPVICINGAMKIFFCDRTTNSRIEHRSFWAETLLTLAL
jgi:hypothetical protein